MVRVGFPPQRDGSVLVVFVRLWRITLVIISDVRTLFKFPYCNASMQSQ